jgi:hypothetical protein
MQARTWRTGLRVWLSPNRNTLVASPRQKGSNVRPMRRTPKPDSHAEERLRHWENGSCDDAVREARAAGLSIARIQQITGLATTTIRRILNKQVKAR